MQYWAAARAAAGVPTDHVAGGTLADVLAEVVARRGERLHAVLQRCSFLVDGAPVGRRDPASVPVGAESVIEVLPPFAGG